MSSNQEKDAHASSSRTERRETPAILHEAIPQTNTPNETTSAAVDEGKEPVGKGSKLFREKMGIDGGQYVYLSHDPNMKKETSAVQQKLENKRLIYRGFYNCYVPVAIVRTPIQHSSTARKEFERECRILKELEVHENFIRYIEHDRDNDYEYIATELCLCSIADLLDPDLMKDVSMKDEILKELGAKEILRQATRGLHYLHQNNFVHRNIKPNNFLIKEINKTGDINSRRFVVKITDFRLTRKYDPHQQSTLSGSAASEGWEAPESKDVDANLSPKLDVFILGCFYHYVLTGLPTNRINKEKPRHPFGDTTDTRRTNINNEIHEVYKGKLGFVQKDKDKDKKKVEKLIKLMLKFKENERPTLDEVLKNPYFNPSEFYKIYDHTKPGLCVIFNQEEFKDPRQNREGSGKDRDALKDTFLKLGFDIKLYENLNSDELKSEINELASEGDFKSYGCLVVCLLSHGIENAIMCHDGKFVNTNKLKYEFSLNNCPSLYGKPKIFIVQSCQGELQQQENKIVAPPPNPSRPISKLKSLPTVVVKHIKGTLKSSPSVVQLTNEEIKKLNDYQTELREMKNQTKAQRNPPLMDFLTIKATLPGFVSYRFFETDEDGEKVPIGSSFIQSLCEILSKEYLEKKTDEGTQHLEDLLRSVQVEINKYSVGREEQGQKRYWQTMLWEVYLSKHIRFRKGVTEGELLNP